MKETQKKASTEHLAKKKGHQASKAKATRLKWPTAKASGTVNLKKELSNKGNIKHFSAED